jgi:hypothetical protein
MGTNEKKIVVDMNSIILSMISEKRFLNEDLMASLIQKEQARVIRSAQSIFIMSINCMNITDNLEGKILKNQIILFFNKIKKIEENIRESDILGWIKKNETIGIVFLDVQKKCGSIIEKKVLDIYNADVDQHLPDLEIKTTTHPVIVNCENTYLEEHSPLENLKKKNRSMNQE